MDIFEQVALLLLYVWFVVRLLSRTFEAGVSLDVLLLLVSEGVIVVLLLLRRPTENISTSFRDWFFACCGSFLPLLVEKGGAPLALHLGVWLMIIGVITHMGAKLSLLRSFGMVPANRGVKINGLYTIVRHPMYAGYFYTHIGFVLSSPSLWNLVLYACTWVCLLYRIFAEEKILRQSPAYQDYAQRVRYRLVPGVF